MLHYTCSLGGSLKLLKGFEHTKLELIKQKVFLMTITVFYECCKVKTIKWLFKYFRITIFISQNGVLYEITVT